MSDPLTLDSDNQLTVKKEEKAEKDTNLAEDGHQPVTRRSRRIAEAKREPATSPASDDFAPPTLEHKALAPVRAVLSATSPAGNQLAALALERKAPPTVSDTPPTCHTSGREQA